MSEVRLIDANALIYKLRRLCPIDFSDVEDYIGTKIDGEMLDKVDVLDVIDNTPTIDPVEHGRWRKVGDNAWKCSRCGEVSCCEGTYCPDCGARMEGEKE